MKKLIAIVVLALGAVTLRAQDAKVIAIDAKDSAEAKQLYDQLNKIEDKLVDLEAEIGVKYLTTTDSSKATCVLTAGTYILPGWEKLFVYSDDFKYIVPDPKGDSVCTSGIFTVPVTQENTLPLNNSGWVTVVPNTSGTSVQ